MKFPRGQEFKGRNCITSICAAHVVVVMDDLSINLDISIPSRKAMFGFTINSIILRDEAMTVCEQIFDYASRYNYWHPPWDIKGKQAKDRYLKKAEQFYARVPYASIIYSKHTGMPVVCLPRARFIISDGERWWPTQIDEHKVCYEVDPHIESNFDASLHKITITKPHFTLGKIDKRLISNQIQCLLKECS